VGVAVVHLVGHPGSGKRTIAVAMAAQARAADPPVRMVVLDNHLTSRAVLAALDIAGDQTVDDVVWSYVSEIRDVVDRAIRDLAPPDVVYVATNVITDVSVTQSPRRLAALAADRGGAYVPVHVRCDLDERLRRVVAPDRHAHRKWTDPVGVAAYVAAHDIAVPESPHALDLDVTDLSPEEAATRVRAHLATI
jgi:RecA/RadA recombinase